MIAYILYLSVDNDSYFVDQVREENNRRNNNAEGANKATRCSHRVP